MGNDKYDVWREGSGLPQVSMSALEEEKIEQNVLIKYLCLCISIYEQSLMDVLWCTRMDDGGETL